MITIRKIENSQDQASELVTGNMNSISCHKIHAYKHFIFLKKE